MTDYLSEVFLDIVRLNPTEEKIRKGLEECGKTLEDRLTGIPTGIGKFLYFFDVCETDEDHITLNEDAVNFREMLDLWDIIKEFADDVRYQNYEIMKACRILYSIHKSNR